MKTFILTGAITTTLMLMPGHAHAQQPNILLIVVGDWKIAWIWTPSGEAAWQFIHD